MSRETRDRVWAHSGMGGNALVLLLQMAERADVDGVCFPGMDLLMAACRRGKSAVKEAIREAVAKGELFAPDVRGAGRESVYFVSVGLSAAQICDVLVLRFGLDENEAALVAQRMAAAGEGGALLTRGELDPGRAACRQKVRETAPLGIEKRAGNPAINKMINDAKKGRKSGFPTEEKGPEIRPEKGRKSGEKGPEIRPPETPAISSTRARFEPSLTVNEPSVCRTRARSRDDTTTEVSEERFLPKDPEGLEASGAPQAGSIPLLGTKAQRAVLKEVLAATDKGLDWEMGRISSSEKIAIHQICGLVAELGHDARDVERYRRDELPAFFRKAPEDVDPPSPAQMLGNYRRVKTRFARKSVTPEERRAREAAQDEENYRHYLARQNENGAQAVAGETENINEVNHGAATLPRG